MKRHPFRAGSFYEADPKVCQQHASQLLAAVRLPDGLPAVVYGGIVPHAGWVFSGRTAAFTLQALAKANRLERLVLLGADHWGIARQAAVYDSGGWLTPLGEVAIDEELAAMLLATCPSLRADAQAHAREHSIEVLLPLAQTLNPGVRIVPINVAPGPGAVEVGRQIGQALQSGHADVAVVASTDLTHYGPQYDFTPSGAGREGLEWARDNDRRIIKLIESMRADRIHEEVQARQNACGPGAIAAAMSACQALGATTARTLDYTTSAEVLAHTYDGHAEDAVGYASIIFV